MWPSCCSLFNVKVCKNLVKMVKISPLWPNCVWPNIWTTTSWWQWIWPNEWLKLSNIWAFLILSHVLTKKIGGEGDNDERRARACYLFWLSVRVKQLHFSQTDRPQFSSSNNVWSSTPFCKSIDEDHWPNVCTHFPKTLRFEWALGKEKDKDRLRKTTPYKSSCVYILLGGRW